MLNIHRRKFCSKKLEITHSPSILIPGFDLCVGQVQLGRKFHAILNTQVFLSFEALLQTVQLMVRKSGPRFSRLLLL